MKPRLSAENRLISVWSTTTSAGTLMLFFTSFLHPLLTGSHTTTRRLGALEASSACRLGHCAPTVQRDLQTKLYNHNLCSTITLRPRHNDGNRNRDSCRFCPSSAAHVTLNPLHFAAYDSLVFRLMGNCRIAVLRALKDARCCANSHDMS